MNFRKSEVDDTLFADQDKLKLVVPCHTLERAEKNVVEEYAVSVWTVTTRALRKGGGTPREVP